MAAQSYSDAIKFVLQWEGGYVNHPSDPGGATNQGITQKTYDAYRKKVKKAPQTVKQITNPEVQAIYLVEYWDKVSGDAQPAPLDLVMFDAAVNHGPGKAKQFLAKAKLTMDDDDTNDGIELARRVVDLRVNFYYTIVKNKPSQKVFLKGWLNRMRALKKEIGY